MGREVIPSGTNGTTPVFESEVNLAVGIEDCAALLAKYRLILNECKALNFLERCVNRTHRHNDPRLSDLVTGPVVPRKAEAILLLSLIEVHIINYMTRSALNWNL